MKNKTKICITIIVLIFLYFAIATIFGMQHVIFFEIGNIEGGRLKTTFICPDRDCSSIVLSMPSANINNDLTGYVVITSKDVVFRKTIDKVKSECFIKVQSELPNKKYILEIKPNERGNIYTLFFRDEATRLSSPFLYGIFNKGEEYQIEFIVNESLPSSTALGLMYFKVKYWWAKW